MLAWGPHPSAELAVAPWFLCHPRKAGLDPAARMVASRAHVVVDIRETGGWAVVVLQPCPARWLAGFI